MGLFGKKKKEDKDQAADSGAKDSAATSKATTPAANTTPRQGEDNAAAKLEKELEGLSPAEKRKALKEKRKAMDWDDDW